MMLALEHLSTSFTNGGLLCQNQAQDTGITLTRQKCSYSSRNNSRSQRRNCLASTESKSPRALDHGQGRPQLGARIGTADSSDQYINNMVSCWDRYRAENSPALQAHSPKALTPPTLMDYTTSGHTCLGRVTLQKGRFALWKNKFGDCSFRRCRAELSMMTSVTCGNGICKLNGKAIKALAGRRPVTAR